MCPNIYGSEIALNLHIKRKHKGGNKSERRSEAFQIIKSILFGKELQEIKFNMYTGFLEVKIFHFGCLNFE